mmetsp:Transcript_109095/g.307549  ORF Transcript_109095/g.307549 Transcript_109095/m.307549 type:complete len:273 (+) Transcript_109095:748-1566(+)
MPPYRYVALLSVLLDLDADPFAAPCNCHWFVVLLDSSHPTDLDIVLLGHAKRRTDTKLAADDVATDNQWVLLPEDTVFVDLQHDREDDLLPSLGLFALRDLFHVGLELIEQMVDDLCRHNLHVVLVGLRLCFFVHQHVERQNDRVFWVALLLHDQSLLHIFLVHLTDADVENRDLHILKEGQQGFERAEGAGLYVHAFGLFLELAQDAVEGVGHLFLEFLDVVVWAHDLELCPRDGLLEAWGANLDAHGSTDLLVVDVIVLHAHFLERLRRE